MENISYGAFLKFYIKADNQVEILIYFFLLKRSSIGSHFGLDASRHSTCYTKCFLFIWCCGCLFILFVILENKNLSSFSLKYIEEYYSGLLHSICLTPYYFSSHSVINDWRFFLQRKTEKIMLMLMWSTSSSRIQVFP